MNRINWTKDALRQLLKIDKRYQKAIREKVNALESFPNEALDTKKLRGEERKWRLRIGCYRIIFEVINRQPRIINIQTIKRRNERTYS
ncbi:type II toxin-antitoxin system RelE family toxin [Rodentibacter heidelbergensis]|uniref:Plasmid stabilization protein n=1 Tax=Rodentibacter heidelbergensis TaxID=1908258 RepID=A0A1V3IBW2_9PAST|nr:type II toxin-antitoxin system RelE/ParE family toxin [Rodentibacter heidelbergensis]OOF37388.1 hypothetical protein BKK48_02150 [Rodentibacter heidelbergensis]